MFVLASYPAKKCRTGRLPRITQRHAFTLGFSIRLRPGRLSMQNVGTFAGAPLFTCFGGISVETKRCEGAEIRAKAAPLKTLGDRTRLQR